MLKTVTRQLNKGDYSTPAIGQPFEPKASQCFTYQLHHDVKLMLIVKKNEKKKLLFGFYKECDRHTPDQKEILEYLCCAIVI